MKTKTKLRIGINNKGQFTIIAALLVAIILVATVVSTYSAIRYNTAGDQPQIMSAIDETNLALRQLLGFTVGYYGSILQVTGNTQFAYSNASNYLRNGLGNIASMKPELGLSFHVSNLHLNVTWFQTSSYSSGRLNITYDLTGEGITGLTYSSQCRLDMQILPSPSGSSAELSVIQDQDQPVNTLTTQNFKFYRYLTSTQSWELFSSTGNSHVYSNGTYVIDVPSGSGVDSSMYLVQVTDTRGIMVIGSSFNGLTSTFAWNVSSSPNADYVDLANARADGVSDVGTHSNFDLQTTSPDSQFDTIAETNTGTNVEQFISQMSNVDGSSDQGIHSSFNNLKAKDNNFDTLTESIAGGTTTLIAGESFEGNWPPTGWTETGNWNKESNARYSGIYSADFDGPYYGSLSGYLRTPVFDCSSSTIAINVDFWYLDAGVDNYEFYLQYFNGYNWITIVQLGVYSEYQWHHYQQRITDSQYFTANFQVRWYADNVDSGEHAYVDLVTITKETTPSYSLDLEGQFTNANNIQTNEYLCIYTGNLASESLSLQVYSSGNWITLIPAFQANQWNNVSVSQYLASTTFTIRFKDAIETGDSSQSSWQIDAVLLHTWTVNYELHLEEQFTNVDYTQSSEYLCIYTGNHVGSESLKVDVWSGSSWVTLVSPLLPNQWNNVTVHNYLTSSSFTIRFSGATQSGDTEPDSLQIDAVLLRLSSALDPLSSIQNSVITVEWLQNGTQRLLGQNLELTTQAEPIPPLPVKSLHLNLTFANGTNHEVYFQVEDWASNYSIPLALTNNATIFSNSQMVVFLLSTNILSATLWWNGSDSTIQAPYAYTSGTFSDNPLSGTLNNGKINLQFGSGFTVTCSAGSTQSTTSFMRINNEASVYGAGISYVIYNGVVRDVVQQEAEWSNGAGVNNDCPNIYANTVLTLPAGADYFTYRQKIMFINSVGHPRTISDLCPLQLTTSLSNVHIQTENGTSGIIPTVVDLSSGSASFKNYGATAWDHHWSQIVSSTGAGTGIIFTDAANQQLYFFDTRGTNPGLTGAIKVDVPNKTIQLAPVSSLHIVSGYDTPLGEEVTWCGAVVTFGSNTTGIYENESGSITGLWVLVENPPQVAVTPYS